MFPCPVLSGQPHAWHAQCMTVQLQVHATEYEAYVLLFFCRTFCGIRPFPDDIRGFPVVLLSYIQVDVPALPVFRNPVEDCETLTFQKNRPDAGCFQSGRYLRRCLIQLPVQSFDLVYVCQKPEQCRTLQSHPCRKREHPVINKRKYGLCPGQIQYAFPVRFRSFSEKLHIGRFPPQAGPEKCHELLSSLPADNV